MDTFVVRIYRREQGPTVPLVGVVEGVGEGTREAFHSLEELAELLGIHPGLRGDEKSKEEDP